MQKIEDTYDHTVEGWESPAAGLPLTSALTDRFPFTHRHYLLPDFAPLFLTHHLGNGHGSLVIDSGLLQNFLVSAKEK